MVVNLDYERIVDKALKDILENLKLRTKRVDKTLVGAKTIKDKPIVNRYTHMDVLYRDWCNLKQAPHNIHTELVEAATLLLEDSIYNLGPKELIDIFNTTDAEIGYGYAVLPIEFLFEDLPANYMYSFESYRTLTGEKRARLTSRGYSNGYDHEYDKWKTLLASPVIGTLLDGKQLIVEIVTCIGPMSVFKIYRSKCGEVIPRLMSLTNNECYVKIMDLKTMFDTRVGGLVGAPIYISVREGEF